MEFNKSGNDAKIAEWVRRNELPSIEDYLAAYEMGYREAKVAKHETRKRNGREFVRATYPDVVDYDKVDKSHLEGIEKEYSKKLMGALNSLGTRLKKEFQEKERMDFFHKMTSSLVPMSGGNGKGGGHLSDIPIIEPDEPDKDDDRDHSSFAITDLEYSSETDDLLNVKQVYERILVNCGFAPPDQVFSYLVALKTGKKGSAGYPRSHFMKKYGLQKMICDGIDCGWKVTKMPPAPPRPLPVSLQPAPTSIAPHNEPVPKGKAKRQTRSTN